VIDPDGYTIQQLIARTNPRYLGLCSFFDADFAGSLMDAMRDGKSLIVTDVNELTPLLESVLPIDLLAADPAMLGSVLIGETVVQRHPRFKLYLETSLRTPEAIPDDLRARVNVTVCAVKSTISMALHDLFRRKVCPACKDGPSGRPLIELRIARMKIESELTDAIAELGGEEALTADDLTLDVLTMKEGYLDVVAAAAEEQAPPDAYAVFLPAIALAVTFWEVLTRFLPRVGCHLKFSARAYISAMDVFAAESTAVEIYAAVRAAALRFALPRLTWRESFYILFVCALRLKKGNLADLGAIAAHCWEALSDAVDFIVPEKLCGDSSEQMKFVNVTTLFPFMHKLITEQFGDGFDSALASFVPEQFIQEDTSVPLIVRCASANYPLQMLLQHVSGLQALDRLQFFSVLDHTQILAVLSKAHHSWVVLHYTRPGRAAAESLGVVARFMQRVESDSRLIVFAETLDGLPDVLLGAQWLAMSDFPSTRFCLEQLFLQYQNTIRSPTNPMQMRKMAATAARFLATMNWRLVLTPVGFVDAFRIPDFMFRDLTALFRALLEIPHKELPVRNFGEILVDFLANRLFVDTVDRVRVANHITVMLGAGSLMDETVKFDSLPILPETDGLYMDDPCAIPLREFNLSMYFVRPIAQLWRPPTVDGGDVTAAIDTALSSIPSEIAIQSTRQWNTALAVFLLSEIQEFNYALEAIRGQLLRRDPAIVEDLLCGRTPQNWLAMVNQAAPIRLLKFLSYCADKSFLLKVWLKSTEPPSPIDVRLISNIRGLFEAYTIEVSLAQNIPAHQLGVEGTIIGERETRRDCLILTNCWLVGLRSDEESGACVEALHPFSLLPQLACEVKLIVQGTKKSVVPLFKSIPSREYALPTDYERIDGELENFVRYIELDSTVQEWANIANSAAVICHIAERFT
jgi:hypothetical protein